MQQQRAALPFLHVWPLQIDVIEVLVDMCQLTHACSSQKAESIQLYFAVHVL